MRRPLIGITPDVTEPKPGSLRSLGALTYQRAIANAGGIPLLLSPQPDLAAWYVSHLDGLVLTGGDDVRMETLGGVTHACAQPMHPARQEFEFALLKAIDARPELPVLGVCLGMQLMCLHNGGELIQHLADTLPNADRHRSDGVHTIAITEAGASAKHALVPGPVTSSHHQAAKATGQLRATAVSDDGVIEAVEHPGKPFYLGVQWHPERTSNPQLGAGLFDRLIKAAGGRSHPPIH